MDEKVKFRRVWSNGRINANKDENGTDSLENFAANLTIILFNKMLNLTFII
jgi:hypothetical protein